MHLIDRFLTTACGPHGDRLNDRPQPPTGATEAATPDRHLRQAPTNNPTITAAVRPSMRPVRWSRLALIVQLVVLALLVSASSAHADTVVLAIAGSVTDVLNNIRNWIMGILAGLATVFLSIGGVRYVMGGSDPGEVEKAKSAFKSAGWGYSLAALAPLVVEILKGIVGA